MILVLYFRTKSQIIFGKYYLAKGNKKLDPRVKLRLDVFRRRMAVVQESLLRGKMPVKPCNFSYSYRIAPSSTFEEELQKEKDEKKNTAGEEPTRRLG